MRIWGLMASLWLLILSGLCASPVAAQSGGYQVGGATYAANTGGVLTSASYQVQGTLGQPAVDISLGENYGVTGGIWSGVQTAETLVLAKEARSNNAAVNRAEAGAALTYILAVTNNGLRAQEYVTITDILPAGLTLLPDSLQSKWGVFGVAGEAPYRVTWTIPTLPANEIAVLTYQAYPLTGTEGLTLTNMAVGVSASAGPVTATASIRVYRPNRLYLPLIMRGYPPLVTPVEPVLHPLADAPAQCVGAAAVVISDIYQDDFATANDNDWYQFTATASGYILETSTLGARADTLLYLYAPADCVNPIAANDDISYPGNRASRIVAALPPGMYYAMVRNWDWQVYGVDTGYRLTVEVDGPLSGDGVRLAPAPVGNIKPTPPPTPTVGDAR